MEKLRIILETGGGVHFYRFLPLPIMTSVMREIELLSFIQEQFEATVNFFRHSVLLQTSIELWQHPL